MPHMIKPNKEKLPTMTFILILCGIALAVFTVAMIIIYVKTGGIPDTLCTCFFAALGTEGGIMGWIRVSKNKLQDRKFELEDREHREKTEKEDVQNDVIQ